MGSLKRHETDKPLGKLIKKNQAKAQMTNTVNEKEAFLRPCHSLTSSQLTLPNVK